MVAPVEARMLKILILLIIIFSSETYAFNKMKCFKVRYATGIGELDIFLATTALPTTTAQYITSTGGCSALGMNEKERVIFVVENSDHLRDESARGTGEYLEAYAILSGCSDHAKSYLPKVFQRNFKQIYGDKKERPLEDVYEEMDNLVHRDPVLMQGCGTKS